MGDKQDISCVNLMDSSPKLGDEILLFIGEFIFDASSNRTFMELIQKY